jgi:hypothetical protein
VETFYLLKEFFCENILYIILLPQLSIKIFFIVEVFSFHAVLNSNFSCVERPAVPPLTLQVPFYNLSSSTAVLHLHDQAILP